MTPLRKPDFRSKCLPLDLWNALSILERHAPKEGVTPEQLVTMLRDRAEYHKQYGWNHDEHGWPRE